jgi:hypothetical protein
VNNTQLYIYGSEYGPDYGGKILVERFTILNSRYSPELAIAGGAKEAAIEFAEEHDTFVAQPVYASMPEHGFISLLAVVRVAAVNNILYGVILNIKYCHQSNEVN